MARAIRREMLHGYGLRGRAALSPARIALLEGLAVAGLLVGASLLRLRDLTTVPSWTDELAEIRLALDIVDGRLFPLTNVHGYIGALWNYLLAGGFLLFGPQPYLPRVFALAFGIATVGATYVLGRQLGGRMVGLLAAGLLGASGAHVLVSSRIAWSHGMTPFFTVLALSLALATPPAGGPRLVLVGLVCGLAIQSHVTGLPVALAIGLYALLEQRAWLRARWALIGAGALVAACWNLLAFNLLSGPLMLRQARFEGDGYKSATGLGLLMDLLGAGRARPDRFLANAGDQALTFFRVLSGAIDIRPSAADFSRDWLVLLVGLLFVVGLVLVTRRVSRLPLVHLAMTALFLLFVNDKNEVIPNSRFLLPAIPVALVAVAYAVVRLGRPAGRWGPAVGVALGAVLVLAALGRLEARLDDFDDSRETSEALERGIGFVLRQRQPEERVYVDPALERLWLDGGGNYLTAVQYRLRLADARSGTLLERSGDDRFGVSPCARQRAVFERVEQGSGQPVERIIPERGWIGSNVVWVVRVARPGEELPGGAEDVTYRPPLAGSGRAVESCEGAGRI